MFFLEHLLTYDLWTCVFFELLCVGWLMVFLLPGRPCGWGSSAFLTKHGAQMSSNSIQWSESEFHKSYMNYFLCIFVIERLLLAGYYYESSKSLQYVYLCKLFQRMEGLQSLLQFVRVLLHTLQCAYSFLIFPSSVSQYFPYLLICLHSEYENRKYYNSVAFNTSISWYLSRYIMLRVRCKAYF